jgi:regulator of protease activity HflC (stomatin/prohibitin superfamily)
MLRYAPQREGIEKYLFGLTHRKDHVAGLFSSLLRNEIANVKAPNSDASNLATSNKEFGGAYALVRRDRQLLNSRIADYAKQKLGDEYGVNFEAIDITDIHPPDELADALNAVMSARSNADSMRSRGQSECAQRVMSAEQGLAIARTKASAMREEIEGLGKHLAQLNSSGVLLAYVDRRRTEVLSEARTVYIKDDSQLGVTL